VRPDGEIRTNVLLRKGSVRRVFPPADALAGPDQKLEMGMAMVRSLPPGLRKKTAQDLVSEWGYRTLRRVLAPLEPDPQEAVLPVVDANPLIGQFAEEWEKFYRDLFSLAVDFSQVRVPIQRPSFNWLEFVAQSIICNQVYARCESLFPCWRWTPDLDAAVKGRNDREPVESYGVWFRDRVEPDEELKDLSANQLAAYGFSGNTLLEALLLEPWYFKRSGGQHLNLANWNLCSGSRYSGGDVPCVNWLGSKFQVDYIDADGADDCLRVRSVVS